MIATWIKSRKPHYKQTGNHGYRYGNAPVTQWFKKQFAPEKMLMRID
jgi:hypothetical protein